MSTISELYKISEDIQAILNDLTDVQKVRHKNRLKRIRECLKDVEVKSQTDDTEFPDV